MKLLYSIEELQGLTQKKRSYILIVCTVSVIVIGLLCCFTAFRSRENHWPFLLTDIAISIIYTFFLIFFLSVMLTPLTNKINLYKKFLAADAYAVNGQFSGYHNFITINRILYKVVLIDTNINGENSSRELYLEEDRQCGFLQLQSHISLLVFDNIIIGYEMEVTA